MYTPEEEKILTLITDYCREQCPRCMSCAEENCVLWRIEKVCTGEDLDDRNQ